MEKHKLQIKLHQMEDLFTAPQQNVLSPFDYIQSGEAALPRAIRYINPKEYKQIKEIDIFTPATTSQDGSVDQIRQQIHHYLHFQINENALEMIKFKQNTSRIFRNAVVFLLICMGIVTVLGTESFLPNMPPLMRSVLVEGFTVVGWVIMWRPIELILNQWTALKIDTKICETLLRAKIKLNT